jgi:hypothetical protein
MIRYLSRTCQLTFIFMANNTMSLLILLSQYTEINFTFMLQCILIDFFLNNQSDALIIQIYSVIKLYSGPGSVVGIATAYGLDGPGIESRWGRDFPLLFRPALRPT